ncbi:MAG: right-handed parallel beta-helix repeat-containing protein [Sphingomonadaceae bacterium]
MKRFALAAACLALAAPLPSLAQGQAPFTIAGTGEGFYRLQDALDAVGDGAATVRIAPGRHRDCAVQEAGSVAYVAERPGTAVFDGVACEGKAALVLRGREAHVEGLIFANIRVPDGNGAGIRIEEGDLSVAETLFENSQSGILSADDPSGHIRIHRSTFKGLGKHPDGSGAHSLYIGRYGSLGVSQTRFEEGRGGHYLKSRAPRIEVLDSSFDDSRGRRTNYHIDLSAGASGRIAGNAFVQGPDKENYGTIIAVAPESRDHSSAGLVIEDNEAWLAPGFARSTVFVGDWSGERVTVRGNRLGDRIRAHERR